MPWQNRKPTPIDTARSKEIHGAEFVAEMVGFLRDHVASRAGAGAGS